MAAGNVAGGHFAFCHAIFNADSAVGVDGVIASGSRRPQRAADRDVAEGRAGAHLDRFLAGFRLRGGVEAVPHRSETCLEVEPRGDAVE